MEILLKTFRKHRAAMAGVFITETGQVVLSLRLDDGETRSQE